MKRIAVAGVASSLLLFSLAAAPAYAQEPVTAVYKCTQIEITNNTVPRSRSRSWAM